MKIRFALVLAMLLLLAVAPMANAQGGAGISYTSSFQLQNLSGLTANVVLDYYDQSGNVVASKPYTIDPNGNKTFVQLTDVNPGFNGSLVVSSDQEIRAINNLAATAGTAQYFESSNGFQAGTNIVNLPLIMCNNSGFNTWFNVQNTGSTPATVNVAYTPGAYGVVGNEGPFTVAAGASKTFDQTAGSATLNCNALKDGTSNKFIGSGKITSDQPIAVTVMEVGTGAFKAMMGYGGFGPGSSTVLLPLLMGNNSNFYTSVQILNTGTQSTQVTLAYSQNSVTTGGFQPADETFTLGAGKSWTIFQNGNMPSNGSTVNNWAGQGRYIGGGKLTNTAGQNLVAIVNQNGRGLVGSGYMGVDPATATAKISMPLIMGNNSTFYTSVQIMNTGAGTAQVTMHYSANTAAGGTFQPQDEVFQLAAGTSKTIFQNSNRPANGSTVNDWVGVGRYIGSATVTINAGTIIAIVNQQSAFPGDQLATNNSFNY